MGKNVLEKLKESAVSVLPIAGILVLLHFTIAPMPSGMFLLFIIGTVLMVLGMGVFTLGTEMSMIPMGEIIGSRLTQTRKLWMIVGGCFFLGILVTIAEPDLHVLAKQVGAVPDAVLVTTVALGVGVFMVLAILRILFRLKLSHMFFALYTLVFLVAAFTAPEYLAMGFDSGGVTTGPITVPFILAMGIGVSAVRGSKSAEEDSFGLCAICSIGPILAILIMGMFFDPSVKGYAFEAATAVSGVGEVLRLYGGSLLLFFREVAVALSPIVIIFGVYQAVSLRLPKSQVIKIGVGILYTFFGLGVFLTGVNIGFKDAGTYLGEAVASLSFNWILYPLSLFIGVFVVAAEPAVHVLNKQVEEITSGSISRRMMMTGLSGGVGVALFLAVLRIILRIDIIYFLLPGYVMAVGLSFVVPPIFTAIAFDSGGVAAGTMAAAFLLPFALGVCNAVGGNPMTEAFGIIAMVATIPIVTIQLMGMLYQIKLRRIDAIEEQQSGLIQDMEIIDFAEQEEV